MTFTTKELKKSLKKFQKITTKEPADQNLLTIIKKEIENAINSPARKGGLND